MHSPLVSPIPSHLGSSSERDVLTALPRLSGSAGQSGPTSRAGAELEWSEENDRLLAAKYARTVGAGLLQLAGSLERAMRCSTPSCNGVRVYGLDVCDDCSQVGAEPVQNMTEEEFREWVTR